MLGRTGIRGAGRRSCTSPRTAGIFGGVLLLTVIHAGLAVVSVPSFYVNLIGSVLIFVAVAVDAVRVNLVGET